MNKEEIYTIRPTRSKLLIVWSILELCTVSLLFAMSFFFLFANSKLIQRGPPAFQLRIQSDSIFAKNTFQLVQQGLKFATYLSNDLNIYINETIPETYLQQIDSNYDNNLYQFNVFGFCRKTQFDKILNCYNGQGINIAACFLQVIGTQLGNLTNQADPSNVSAKLVSFYYNLVDQICSDSDKKLCALQTYNTMSRIVQYLGISSLICLAVTTATSFFEMIGYCVFAKSLARVFFIVKVISMLVFVFTICTLYCIIMVMKNFLTDLITQFQIGTLEFPSIKWITWGVLTLMCLIIVVKRYLIYQSI